MSEDNKALKKNEMKKQRQFFNEARLEKMLRGAIGYYVAKNINCFQKMSLAEKKEWCLQTGIRESYYIEIEKEIALIKYMKRNNFAPFTRGHHV